MRLCCHVYVDIFYLVAMNHAMWSLAVRYRQFVGYVIGIIRSLYSGFLPLVQCMYSLVCFPVMLEKVFSLSTSLSSWAFSWTRFQVRLPNVKLQ